MVKSGQLTNIVDSVSTTNQQNLSTVKNVDLRKSHPHQQNWSIVQIVDSLLDPNQQSVSLKIGETTKCTLGFFLHNNKFVDQQSGSNVQIVVSGPTSTNCVIPNLPRGSRQLYRGGGGNVFDDGGDIFGDGDDVFVGGGDDSEEIMKAKSVSRCRRNFLLF